MDPKSSRHALKNQGNRIHSQNDDSSSSFQSCHPKNRLLLQNIREKQGNSEDLSSMDEIVRELGKKRSQINANDENYQSPTNKSGDSLGNQGSV